MILAEKQRLSENLYNNTEYIKKPRNYQREILKPLFRIVGIFLCLLVANVWIQVLVVKRNDEIRGYQTAIRELERTSIKIRIEMAKLESFERIQTIAQKELGMRVAGPNDYRCIAAAPVLKSDEPRPYNYVANTTPQNSHLWARLAAWFEGIRSVMAQTP